MAISGLPPMIAHIQSGRLRALAVTGPSRMAQLPDVPTVTEAGFKDIDVSRVVRRHRAGGHAARRSSPKLNDAFEQGDRARRKCASASSRPEPSPT